MNSSTIYSRVSNTFLYYKNDRHIKTIPGWGKGRRGGHRRESGWRTGGRERGGGGGHIWGLCLPRGYVGPVLSTQHHSRGTFGLAPQQLKPGVLSGGQWGWFDVLFFLFHTYPPALQATATPPPPPPPPQNHTDGSATPAKGTCQLPNTHTRAYAHSDTPAHTHTRKHTREHARATTHTHTHTHT